jgi:hypothetical protein
VAELGPINRLRVKWRSMAVPQLERDPTKHDSNDWNHAKVASACSGISP